MHRKARIWAGALLALPAGLTIYLAFNAGGYFNGGSAAVAVVLAVALAVRILTERNSLAGLSALGLAVVVALGGMAAWTLLSGARADSWFRALAEFDRVLAYLLALVVFGTLPRRASDVAVMLRWFAGAVVVVCGVSLASRVLPNIVEAAPNVANSRLSYPITYWNALGLLGTLGAIACFHLSADSREPRAARILAAAALPLLLVTVYFTFSRAAIAAGAIGLVAYVVLARPRGLVSALASVVPPAAVAIAVAYGADLLATRNPTAAAAAPQADRVAAVTAGAMLAAGLLRALLLPLDRRLERVQLAPRTRRLVALSLAAALLLAVAVPAIAFDAPGRISEQYDRFVGVDEVRSGGDTRTRLSSIGNNGRVDNWTVALRGFEDRPLAGGGAGTFELLWARERDTELDVVDAHSLYLETLAELGLVGGVLLLVALGGLVIGLARRARGPRRALFAGLLAMTIAWGLCVGVDWQWEMPVTTLWLFALGGAAVAQPAAEAPPPRPLRRLTRLLAALGCLVLAVTPALVYLSQRKVDDAVEALEAGDCTRSIDSALSASRLLSLRPEPFELLGYCDIRIGRPELAVRVMRQAVDRDPQSWRLRYGLALVRGASGADPRPEAQRALRLNPLEPRVREAVRSFRTSRPAEWRRRALAARLPLD